ncbi:hypothetical protein [Methylobacterium sp. Leaf118]|uniref:hypothetical protein n=1 Tax=Methylobacterium sp. Leaf118 TaxID=2876562 RepID=UPI001E410049|nr:hypothetical protein [Methylobacterium sp. Leaf118]
MAACLGTIGGLHRDAGETRLADAFTWRPAWRSAWRARLAPFLGAPGREIVAARRGW